MPLVRALGVIGLSVSLLLACSSAHSNNPADAGGMNDELSDNDCVVAAQLNHCCHPWVAVTQAQAEAELCLVAVGEHWPNGQQRNDCAPPRDDCAGVDCVVVPAQPPTRIARRSDGACQLADECVAAADCVLASDLTDCCACTTSIPKSLVEEELCLAPEDEALDHRDCVSATDCLTVLCAECEAPEPPTCATGGSFKRCE